MKYGFDEYIGSLPSDWYTDDALLRSLLARYAGAAQDDAERSLRSWGARVAGDLRRLAEESALPENRPSLRHYDAYDRRVDEVVLPASTLRALAELHGGAGLGAVRGDPFVFYTRIYLYAQNGEAGVACSLACTDGLVRVLEAVGERKEHGEAAARVRASSRDRIWHAAQFVTEIQGGSDVGANRTIALSAGDHVLLSGHKWFCSNINADYFLVTARAVDGGAGEGGADAAPVGLYLVPAYLEGSTGSRNGHLIQRLKEKLGTRELATAEVTFGDAVGYPVGAPERGLANLLTHVLTPSRFACVLFAAATLRTAERLVEAYSDFRTAFGRRLVDFPLVRERLLRIRRARTGALVCMFELQRLWDAASAGSAEARVDFRILLSLCKTVHTAAATHWLHEAMMVLGGNGIEERFSSLPRLYRDAVIMETWEGPHDVLLSQALRDFRRLEVDPAGFAERILGARTPLADELARIVGVSQDPAAMVSFAGWSRRFIAEWGEQLAR